MKGCNLDPDGTILYCNNRFAEMLKTPAEQVIGSSVYRFIPPQTDPTLNLRSRKESNETPRQHLFQEGRAGLIRPMSPSICCTGKKRRLSA